MGKRKKAEKKTEHAFWFRWKNGAGVYLLQYLGRLLADLQVDLENGSIHSFGWGWEGDTFVLTEVLK
jgi:hypothetical protein